MGLTKLEISYTKKKINLLLKYIELLYKWNKIHNLTAIRDPMKMVTYHLLDSLSILPFILSQDILDVGTGAGLPGIPLAICCPDLQFSLLDSNQKKMTFVKHVVLSLGLSNINVLPVRVEGLSADNKYGTIISRAYASLGDFISSSGHLCKQEGCLLAMKTELDEDEIKGIRDSFKIVNTTILKVPGIHQKRCVVIIKPAI